MDSEQISQTQTPGESGSGPPQSRSARVETRPPESAIGKVAEVAQQAGQHVRATGNSVASAANAKVKELITQQIAAGGHWVGHLAESTNCAADNLEKNTPEFAGFVRQAADSIRSFSNDLRDRSVEELIERAADLTRRQPALVFGMAAVFGFFAFRLFKSGSPVSSGDSINQGQL
jgi:ABC-type transporter Mla subunit MlaD